MTPSLLARIRMTNAEPTLSRAKVAEGLAYAFAVAGEHYAAAKAIERSNAYRHNAAVLGANLEAPIGEWEL